ncbi:MAG: hypothetical protein SGILL_009978, partial [Bacillariaceae sp.]
MKITVPATTLLFASTAHAYLMPGSDGWSALEAPGGAFDKLKDTLSSPDILTQATPQAWSDECSQPFEEAGYPLADVAPLGVFTGSNYELFEQPSGLCSDHLSCAYHACRWPYAGENETDISDSLASGEFLEEENLNLPEYVLHPVRVGDIIAVVNFAHEHDIAISVKTSGHSYLGSSTSKGSILIHMSSYTKYSDDWDTAATVCDPLLNSDLMEDVLARNGTAQGGDNLVCALARDRGMPAALRVGGGQVWDEVYRAVNKHNANTNRTNQQYHIVGGAAGTVSAAGGWLSGGGLSGTSGMRLFGFGVDQILRLEMVLANGQHVRFGPAEWSMESSDSFPITTAIYGECNLGATTVDESQWDWQPCPENTNIDFDGLWYAARGGGGGFGVVTSATFQLPEKPGKMQYLYNVGVPPEVMASLSESAIRAMRELWMNFLVDFFFDPAALNVTDAISNACGSPALGMSMDIFVGGSVFCHDGAGSSMLQSWERVVVGSSESLQEAGVPVEVVPVMTQVFVVAGEAGDVVELNAVLLELNPPLGAGVPPGRMLDYPKPNVVPTYYGSQWNAILPKSWLLQKEKSIPFLYDYATSSPLFARFFYVLGGRTATDQDQMNAVSINQRDGSFVIPMFGPEERTERLLTEIYGPVNGGEELPASAEFNHVGVNEFGPLKSDWTKPCPMALSREEKTEQCVSLQESVWGTSNLAKLTEIKQSIDPNNRFNCFGCVGYKDILANSDTPSMAPTAESAGNTLFQKLSFIGLL